jgi:hypothetical protein
VELLFAKNVFGAMNIKVSAKTVIVKQDTGEWTDLAELKAYVNLSLETLKAIVEKQTDADWKSAITTKEFAT